MRRGTGLCLKLLRILIIRTACRGHLALSGTAFTKDEEEFSSPNFSLMIRHLEKVKRHRRLPICPCIEHRPMNSSSYFEFPFSLCHSYNHSSGKGRQRRSLCLLPGSCPPYAHGQQNPGQALHPKPKPLLGAHCPGMEAPPKTRASQIGPVSAGHSERLRRGGGADETGRDRAYRHTQHHHRRRHYPIYHCHCHRHRRGT